jgi:hypothetical protein
MIIAKNMFEQCTSISKNWSKFYYLKVNTFLLIFCKKYIAFKEINIVKGFKKTH